MSEAKRHGAAAQSARTGCRGEGAEAYERDVSEQFVYLSRCGLINLSLADKG